MFIERNQHNSKWFKTTGHTTAICAPFKSQNDKVEPLRILPWLLDHHLWFFFEIFLMVFGARSLFKLLNALLASIRRTASVRFSRKRQRSSLVACHSFAQGISVRSRNCLTHYIILLPSNRLKTSPRQISWNPWQPICAIRRQLL